MGKISLWLLAVHQCRQSIKSAFVTSKCGFPYAGSEAVDLGKCWELLGPGDGIIGDELPADQVFRCTDRKARQDGKERRGAEGIITVWMFRDEVARRVRMKTWQKRIVTGRIESVGFAK